MSRVRLCEFVTSKGCFRNIKNGAAKCERDFVEPSGVEHGFFYDVVTIKLHQCPKLIPMPAGHNALNDSGLVLLYIYVLYVGIPKEGRTEMECHNF